MNDVNILFKNTRMIKLVNDSFTFGLLQNEYSVNLHASTLAKIQKTCAIEVYCKSASVLNLVKKSELSTFFRAYP